MILKKKNWVPIGYCQKVSGRVSGTRQALDEGGGDDVDDGGSNGWSQVCNYTFSRPSTPFTIDSNGLLTLQVVFIPS